MTRDMEQKRKNRLDRYNELKQEAITALGGHCVVCGTIENLDFDHIDPSTKLFTITQALSKSVTVTDDLFWIEVSKCQLLCRPHHKEKSRLEGSYFHLGVSNGRSKLRELDIKYIRELSRLGHSNRAIAKEFNVSSMAVFSVVKRRTWTHVL